MKAFPLQFYLCFQREITLSDVTEAQGAFEELYVNVSADTFDKVDAAISLIELLVTPVSVSFLCYLGTSRAEFPFDQ